jgi:hypothetical protein
VFADLAPTIDETGVLSSILLGSHARVNGGFARTDDAVIKLTGKVEGFDYAAAAARHATLIDDSTLPGDVNGDGEVNVGDLVSVSNFMAGEGGDITLEAADVNKDGEVNVGDMVVISNIMSGNE